MVRATNEMIEYAITTVRGKMVVGHCMLFHDKRDAAKYETLIDRYEAYWIFQNLSRAISIN